MCVPGVFFGACVSRCFLGRVFPGVFWSVCFQVFFGACVSRCFLGRVFPGVFWACVSRCFWGVCFQVFFGACVPGVFWGVCSGVQVFRVDDILEVKRVTREGAQNWPKFNMG